nr:uncharacterized protein LOC125421524 [Ziziphus jujuba var. spinosa]
MGAAQLDKGRHAIAKQLLQLAMEGKTKRFWIEDGLLYTKGRRIYVPWWDNIRKNLIKECHDTKWAGHPGQKRTRALLETNYYWPQMWDDIEMFTERFHPQTDGQTERANALLELYLRHFVSANQHDWAKLLDVA